MENSTQITNNQNVNNYYNFILELKENKKLLKIGESKIDGSPNFLISEHELFGYNVRIVKCQWTKTQKTYGIEIDNYYTGKNHSIRITNYTKRQAIKLINEAKESGELYLWTNHCIVDKNKFPNFNR